MPTRCFFKDLIGDKVRNFCLYVCVVVSITSIQVFNWYFILSNPRSKVDLGRILTQRVQSTNKIIQVFCQANYQQRFKIDHITPSNMCSLVNYTLLLRLVLEAVKILLIGRIVLECWIKAQILARSNFLSFLLGYWEI